jgi:glycosyltransferase involved in cell wall biosynthesis
MQAPRARILFIGPNLGAGGAERQWSILVPALRRRGYDARLIALDAGGAFEAPLRAAGVPLDVLRMRHQFDLPRLLRSPILRGFRPELVISRGASGLYIAHAVSRLRGAGHLYAEHRQVGLELSPRRERMFRLLAPRIDGVILVSGGQAREWRGWGAPASRLHIVANGVPTPGVTEPRAEIRAQLGLEPDAVVAVAVASMRSVKRHPDFVHAVRIAARDYPQLTGIVVGDGPDRPAVQAAAAGDPRIVLLGHRDDVARILTAADLFVLASEREAAPMAILEAMAAGLPVIATAVGSVPEIVSEGETGRLVAPGQPEALARALAELASDPELRARMGAAARRLHRERFDAEPMVDHYERLIGEASNRSGATAR